MSQLKYVLVVLCAIVVGQLSTTTAAQDTPKNIAAINSSVLPGQGAAANAESSTGTPLPPLEIFRSLDEETELLVKEVLNLSSDLSVIQEEEANPSKFQVLVMVTMDPTQLFVLDYVQLEIDNEVVAAYQYSSDDIEALKKGAGHRLFMQNFPAGMHELNAVMVGRIPRDPDYKREVSYKFITGVARTVLELSVNSEKKGFPTLVVKEWN